MPRAAIPARLQQLQQLQLITAAVRDAQGAVAAVNVDVIALQEVTDGLDVTTIQTKLDDYETRLEALEGP